MSINTLWLSERRLQQIEKEFGVRIYRDRAQGQPLKGAYAVNVIQQFAQDKADAIADYINARFVSSRTEHAKVDGW